MKKKTKITLIVSSIAVILLAGACVIGGTYALFTSEEKVNIAVKSGTVKIVATVEDFTTWSGNKNSLTGVPANDETNIKKSTDLGLSDGNFLNGGTGKYTPNEGEGKIELTKMTPGDRVTFNIKITNKGNIAIKYRILFSKDSTGDQTLYDALEMKFGSLQNIEGNTKTEWSEVISANETESTIGESLNCSITLPTDKINEEYGEKKCSIVLKVEAVQGNYVPASD